MDRGEVEDKRSEWFLTASRKHSADYLMLGPFTYNALFLKVYWGEILSSSFSQDSQKKKKLAWRWPQGSDWDWSSWSIRPEGLFLTQK